nr:DUF4129 domain-containing protein [Streptomyces sp. CBMA29]
MGNGGGPRTSAGARAALGVLVIGGLALSALLLRPEGTAFGKGGGPLGGTVLVAALGLAWFIGALMLHNRYVLQVGDDAESDPLRQRLVDVVRAALLGAAFAVPLLIFVMHRFHASGRTPGGGKDRQRRDATAPPPSAPTPPRPLKRQDNHGFLSWLPHVLIGIGIALLVLAVVFAAVLLWRYLRSGEAEQQDGPGYEQADDEDELLAEAVESGRRALRDDADARAAVIACYAAMERSLAASGIARRASDSPQDLLERASTAGRLAGPSAAALTALFREARYSTHPMGDGHRDRAARALTEIAAQLAANDGASGDGGGPGERTAGTAAEATP